MKFICIELVQLLTTVVIIWWNASEIQTGAVADLRAVSSSLDWLSTDMYRQGPSCIAPNVLCSQSTAGWSLETSQRPHT